MEILAETLRQNTTTPSATRIRAYTLFCTIVQCLKIKGGLKVNSSSHLSKFTLKSDSYNYNTGTAIVYKQNLLCYNYFIMRVIFIICLLHDDYDCSAREVQSIAIVSTSTTLKHIRLLYLYIIIIYFQHQIPGWCRYIVSPPHRFVPNSILADLIG